jgi:hypothetical protein
MTNSSSRSEALPFAVALAALMLVGTAVQAWLTGWQWFTLAWLLPALGLLFRWVQRTQTQQRYIDDIQAMAQEAAQGKFDRRITKIPDAGPVSTLCWDMNDMLDQLEACFREQATALKNVSAGRYYRLAQSGGLRGGFHASLQAANGSLKTIEQKALQEEKDAAEKLLRLAHEQRVAAENLRIRNALDKCSTNVMIANADHEIIYMNETVAAMMLGNEAELRKVLPRFDARALIGQNIDVFHKDPSHQRKSGWGPCRSASAPAPSSMPVGSAWVRWWSGPTAPPKSPPRWKWPTWCKPQRRAISAAVCACRARPGFLRICRPA